ncbi:MAG: heavy-metal-associated domain-containing protein [Ignavibacteriales bacterium]|nr:heavy-metal-associated domain-containing protein [Ignavibacteriales bacterium]
MLKRLLILPIILLVFLSFNCVKQAQLETVMIHSSGIGCSHCEDNIKNAIYALEGVKEVNVDLEKKNIEVKFVPTQTNLQTIEITLTRAGYDANDKKRDPDAYDNLDECCKHG